MKKRGFTLVELLTVISIIGILLSLVSVNVVGARKRARISQAKADVSRIALSVSMLYSDTRLYPGYYDSLVYRESSESGHPNFGTNGYDVQSADAGLATGGNYGGWKGPYFTGSQTDPWGGKYYFDYNYANSCEDKVIGAIFSMGPDKISGTGDDIYKIMAYGSAANGDYDIAKCKNNGVE